MGRAMFFVAVLVVVAYYVFFKNFQSHMGITPQTPQRLEDRDQTERSDPDNSNTSSDNHPAKDNDDN